MERSNSAPPETLEFIAWGKSAVVYGVDDHKVLKEYHNSDGRDVERRAENGSIFLERGKPLRKILECQAPGVPDQVSLHKKVCWLKQAAEGHRHLHDKGIIHADIGCHNMIVTADDCLNVIDFEGSSIDDGPAGSLYEWFSYRQSTPTVSRQTDIFAFGCATYEVITGNPPYHELGNSEEDPSRRVQELYGRERFPDVASLPLAGLMQNCWRGGYESMDEVLKAFERVRHSWFGWRKERRRSRPQFNCHGWNQWWNASAGARKLQPLDNLAV